MKTSSMVTGVVAAAFLSGSMMAMAQQPQYSYFEGGYGRLDVDGLSGSGEGGYWAGFSSQVGEPFYLAGSLQRFDIDTFYGSESLDFGKLNLGYRAALSDSVDFNAEFGYDWLDLAGESSDGFRGAVGLRASSSTNFQSRIYAGYTADDDFGDGGYLLGLEGTFSFTEHVGLTLQAETYEADLTIFRGGVRLMF